MSTPRIAALDIGGTNIKACLFCEGIAGKLIETPTEAQAGSTHMLQRLFTVLEKLSPFDAIGVSTAGQVDPEKGLIRYANQNMPGYTGTNLRELLEDHFHVPTAIINDAYAAALGEGAYGAAKGEADYLCLTYGTGIGGGIILNGSPYYGTGASAGVMLGGLLLHPEKAHAEDPFSGSYERFASASALVKRAMQIDSSLNNGRIIFSRMEEPQIRTIVDHWLDEVSTGLCSLIHIYNVPCIILGGGVMEQSYVIDGVRTRTSIRLIPGFRPVRIKKARLGNMAGLYGALEIASQIVIP